MYSSNYYTNQHIKQVLIVGECHITPKLMQDIKKASMEFNVTGYVGINNDDTVNGFEYAGKIEELEDILKNTVVDEVFFTVKKDYLKKVEKYILLCEQMGITVRILLDTYNLKLAKTALKNVGAIPLLTFYTVPMNPFKLLIKRAIDIVGAAVGLGILGICSLVVVPAIKLDSPGPAFFRQDRVGLNGRRFKLYKFRTMYTDAEGRKKELLEENEVATGHMFKMKNDPRITKVGAFLRKTSLDELPQFINVLKGDMSLVGTRPPIEDEVIHYETHHFRRLSIRPGITGLWQVSGRSNITDFEEVVKLDTRYIDEWSLWLDFKILLKTIIAVLNSKSAY